MPVLKPTAFSGTITWLGRVGEGLASVSAERLVASLDGVLGEKHSGATRASCSRVTAQYPRGTEIANTRQLSLLAAEDLAAMADAMGLESLSPALLGASMVVEGIPDFSHIPPGSRLQAASGATLVIDLENRPCTLPAREIEALHPGFGARFKPAAKGRRGVVAWVERAGEFRLGETLRLHVPDQPVWAHLAEARR
jgi:hypothetical protein